MSGRLFNQASRVFIARYLSPDAQSRHLAATARAGRDELIRSGRATPGYRTFVDGVAGASEDQVRPNGEIVYRFALLAEAAAFALQALQDRSPEQRRPQGQKHNTPVRYRDTFYLGIGGRFIRASSFDTQKVDPATDEIIIGNTQPFSRLVDVQLAGTRTVSFSIEPGLFADVVLLVRRRFPNLNAQRVGSMAFTEQYVRTSTNRGGASKGQRRGAVQSPALILSTR